MPVRVWGSPGRVTALGHPVLLDPLYGSGPTKWPADGEPVTVGIGMPHAVFSSDGSRLAYSRGRAVSNIWRVPILENRAATWTDAEQLTFDEANIDFVDASPEGDRLLIASERSGNRDLWMLRRGAASCFK